MDFILTNLILIIFVLIILVLLGAILFMSHLIKQYPKVENENKYKPELYENKPEDEIDDFQEMLNQWNEPQEGR